MPEGLEQVDDVCLVLARKVFEIFEFSFLQASGVPLGDADDSEGSFSSVFRRCLWSSAGLGFG